ncbi:MAG: helix-turn-helix domain-containing protein [Saprospiraceae bacterium]
MKESSNISEYHLHKEEPAKRQFDYFDLGEYLQRNLEHSSKPHSHSFYQLIWFHSNEGAHFIDFKSVEIKKNRLFFIAKNQVHYFEKRKDYQGILLHFNESFLLQNEKDIDFYINYNLFNNLKTSYFQIPTDLIECLTNYIIQIKNELNNVHSFGHDSILTNVLKSFLITIEREKRKEPQEGILPAHSLSFLKFRNLLEVGYYKNWTVSKYAEELNITTKTLNNIIKSKTGKTASALINERIILEAKRRLCHTDSFVNEIGFHLGFQDPSYFVKFFKKHVNLTPSEFRKSIS